MPLYSMEYLPVTLLREYAWCPRTAFYKLHSVMEPVTWSMAAGRYEPALIEGLLRRSGYRGRLLLEQRLESRSLGLRGRVDALLVSEEGDGEAAPVERRRGLGGGWDGTCTTGSRRRRTV